MSEEERNKALARRIFEDLFNRGDESWLDELFGPDATLYSPTLDEPGDAEDIKEFVRGLHRGFPDFHAQVEDMIAEKDKVAVRWRTTQQTHNGWYRDLPPTGRKVKMTGVHIFRFADGKLCDTWLEIDALGGVQQMGVLPPPGIGTFGRVRFMLGSLVRLAFLEARSRRSKPKASSRAN
jgi:predicted ester cyclase